MLKLDFQNSKVKACTATLESTPWSLSRKV